MEKHIYNQLATKVGHNHIHFLDSKGKVIKKVEAKA